MKRSLAATLVFGFILVTCANVYALATANQSGEEKGLFSKKMRFDEVFKKWKLELSNKQINDLTNLSDVKNIKKVEWLYLDNNNISSINPNDFAECENLKELHLGSNYIGAITIGMLACLKKLEYLDISWNPIKSLEPRALAPMAKTLKELHIDKKLLDNEEISDQLKKDLPNTKICKTWPKNSSTSLDGWISQQSLEPEKNLRIPDLVIVSDFRWNNNRVPNSWKVEFKETKE